MALFNVLLAAIPLKIYFIVAQLPGRFWRGIMTCVGWRDVLV